MLNRALVRRAKVLSQSRLIAPSELHVCLGALEMGRPQWDGGSVDEERNLSREFYSTPPTTGVAVPNSIGIQLLFHLKVTSFFPNFGTFHTIRRIIEI
jgi:hypothetical protein